MNEKIINLEHVKNNLSFFKNTGKKLVIMVKADAYGHGIKNIAKILKKEDVCLGVATLEEGKKLRKLCKNEILVVEPLKEIEHIAYEDFFFCVDDFEVLKKCKQVGILNRCYLKIDIGMNRFGVACDEHRILKKMARFLKNQEFKGLMAHFSSLSDKEQTKIQYEKLCRVKKWFKDAKVSLGGSFICNYDFEYDELRVGIGFYGYGSEKLKPIMQIESEILKVFRLKKGERLGYDGAFIAEKDMIIGVVGIGYGDGLNRLTSGYFVSVNGKKCNIIGKICMDCLFIDLSEVCVKQGDKAELLSDVEGMSKYLNTIPYEIVTNLGLLRGESKIVVSKRKDEEYTNCEDELGG